MLFKHQFALKLEIRTWHDGSTWKAKSYTALTYLNAAHFSAAMINRLCSLLGPPPCSFFAYKSQELLKYSERYAL